MSVFPFSQENVDYKAAIHINYSRLLSLEAVKKVKLLTSNQKIQPCMLKVSILARASNLQRSYHLPLRKQNMVLTCWINPHSPLMPIQSKMFEHGWSWKTMDRKCRTQEELLVIWSTCGGLYLAAMLKSWWKVYRKDSKRLSLIMVFGRHIYLKHQITIDCLVFLRFSLNFA